MTEESITFFHIAKNVFDAKDFVDKFRGGLKPIGADTGDSEQKQDGVYISGEPEVRRMPIQNG